MHTTRTTFLLLITTVVVAVMTLASPAFAFGSISLKQSTIEEVDGRWKLEFKVDYGRQPHLAHIPFDFIFVQKVYYEYSITDGDKEPQTRPKPMVNQSPQREQIDIGFADARGDVWRRSEFSFSMRRDRGFTAGEYTLVVKQSSDGAVLGREMKIILKGQNELIDRRAIVFTGETRKKPEAQSADAPRPEAAVADPEEDEDDDEDADEQPSQPAAPPPVEKKAKGAGCGCRTATSPGDAWLAPSLGMMLLGCCLGLRRRTQR